MRSKPKTSLLALTIFLNAIFVVESLMKVNMSCDKAAEGEIKLIIQTENQDCALSDNNNELILKSENDLTSYCKKDYIVALFTGDKNESYITMRQETNQNIYSGKIPKHCGAHFIFKNAQSNKQAFETFREKFLGGEVYLFLELEPIEQQVQLLV